MRKEANTGMGRITVFAHLAKAMRCYKRAEPSKDRSVSTESYGLRHVTGEVRAGLKLVSTHPSDY